MERTLIPGRGNRELLGPVQERIFIALESHIDKHLMLTGCVFSRYCFPFGRPEGALKATLSLLERVSIRITRVVEITCIHVSFHPEELKELLFYV